MKLICIVIPAYNEEDRISDVLSSICKLNLQLPIIVVDDGSTDSTSIKAEEYTPYVINNKVRKGKGSAVRIGCEFALNLLKAEHIILIDADGQHDIHDLPKFIKVIYSSDVVLGVRRVNRNTTLSTIMSRAFFSFLILLLYRVFSPDPLCGFKAVSKSAFTKIKCNQKGYATEIEFIVKLINTKLSYTYVTVNSLNPKTKKSGCTPQDGLSILTELIKQKFA